MSLQALFTVFTGLPRQGAGSDRSTLEALRRWKPLLRAGACLAFTDITWLCTEPPAEAVAFFEEEYPAVTTAEGNRRRELSARPDVAAVVASVEREIDVFSRYGSSYGYVFYLLRKPAVPGAG